MIFFLLPVAFWLVQLSTFPSFSIALVVKPIAAMTPSPQLLPSAVLTRAMHFDPAVALEHLYYTEMTNCDTELVMNWTCGWCKPPAHPLTEMHFLDSAKEETHGYVARVKSETKHTPTAIIIAFRGSSNVRNWIDDLTFKKEKLGWKTAPADAKVHTGFKIAYYSLRDELLSRVADLLNVTECENGCSAHVIGHSLGGAMATFAALDLHLLSTGAISFSPSPSRSADVITPLQPQNHEQRPFLSMAIARRVSPLFRRLAGSGKPPSSGPLTPAITLTTFGSPRVGNPSFAKWATDLVHPDLSVRLVNQNDMIPSLPPASFGFYHLGTEVWERRDATNATAPDTFYVCNGSGEEDPVCSRRAGDSTEDHMRYFHLNMGTC